MTSTRREFLMAAGGAALLAACGGDPKGASSSVASGSGFQVVQRFSNTALFVPGDVRLPFSLAVDGTLQQSGPASLKGWIEDADGTRLVDITGVLRAEGIGNPYWEVRTTLEKALLYTARFEGDDGYGAAFELFERGEVKSPLIGDPMPPFDTPTVDDHRGVEPYCTLSPEPCPFHEVTLTEALASGKPVVYVVGTPAHCQTGTCAPGLQFAITEQQRVGDAAVFVHADVYADDAATTVAPAVVALHVDYEPIVYLCDAKGTLVDRLDAVWDASELRDRIDALLA